MLFRSHTLQNNSQLIRGLDSSTDGRQFVNRLAGRCALYMEQWLGSIPRSAASPANREASFAFLTGGGGSVIEWWLRSGMKAPPKEIAALIVKCSEIIVAGLSR